MQASASQRRKLIWILVLILLLILLALIGSCRACTPPGGEDGGGDGGKVVFASQATFNGNLGNFAGADTKCQSAANGAGLSGTFKAWLSGRIDTVANGGGTQHAANRMTHSAGAYVLSTGTKVADNWADLTDGSLDHGIDRDEHGNPVDGSVWTNTTVAGMAVDHTRDCGPGSAATAVWGSADQFESGHFGNVGDSGASWTTNTNTACNNSFHLYCFEQ